MSEETKTPAYDPDWPLGWRVFQITEQAIADAERLGFTGDVAAKIHEMAYFGVPFTHPLGNWRFEGYVFRRSGRHIILGVNRIPPGHERGFNRQRNKKR